ncbi:MAG: tRNA (adenosine(37)-N6)-dimethylallyltransferase MiaA [Deltaproteobacteria bacterium]|nr:tRNA (adenosine(37)-N6)-dimethylallyltransferase MiaA [Deltaproteobacteria bacterium]
MPIKPKIIVITGPTASGKSAVAIEVAQAITADIINADSMAFYKGFDIGSAKPSNFDRQLVNHHLLDVVAPDSDFTCADFVKLAHPIIRRLYALGRFSLVVGGTGLYIRSLTKGIFNGPGRDDAYRRYLIEQESAGIDLHKMLTKLDPQSAMKIKPSDRARIERALEVLHLTGVGISYHQQLHKLADRPYDFITIIIDRPADELNQIIKTRTERMFKEGLIEETRELLNTGYSPQLKPFKSVGYLEATEFIAHRLTLQEAIESTIKRTKQLVKRQRTWLRGQCPGGLWMKPVATKITKVIRDFLALR